jgi:hypothetical protein
LPRFENLRFAQILLAIRSIFVRRTRIEQMAHYYSQASSVAFAASGFGAAPPPGLTLNS